MAEISIPKSVRVNRIGQRFYRLIVTSFGLQKNSKTFWTCLCDCGKYTTLRSCQLTSGGTKSCGCLKNDADRERWEIKRRKLHGLRFGKLVAIEISGRCNSGKILWKCQCDCGIIRSWRSNDLLTGKATHCGCSPKHQGPPRKEMAIVHGKACNRCKIFRLAEDFSPNKKSPDGLLHICRICRASSARALPVTPEKRASYNERAARRKKAIKQATPTWSNRKKIRAIYVEATSRSIETGIEHHVDHVIPIKGKTCCGLHVEHNLEVVTASYNHRKRSKFEPYCVENLDVASS